MYLSRLEIHRFRNLRPATFEFSPFRNYVFGDNAQGKTNLIEAIYLLCLAKSFRTREDVDLVPFSENGYLVEGRFLSNESISHHAAIMLDAQQGKQIKIDGKRLNQFSKLVGLFPIIVLSVDDYEITSGPPAQRRRFFNILLSQCSSRYLDDLKRYEKVLKQRNVMLQERVAGRRNGEHMLDAWNTQLVQFGAQLMRARAAIVDELNSHLTAYYSILTNKKWSLRVDYHPNIRFKMNDIETRFESALNRVRHKEKKQAKTLVGPHRDDFIFAISDHELRKFGSRGEHKSALVSLKAAEAQVLYKRTENHPILLLDDLFAELDRDRSSKVLELFDPSSQVFVTGTSLDYAGLRPAESTAHQSTFIVDNGKINRV
ncbi:DNA replication/repair protein RecF [candidate division KSB1 bacterium]|nr:DNA replication/repair protein RecF [candidate division KSB1 bacterium]RQW02579.1 MAG: DNA replication/repair protein RecF [candidate division KSB1 bacterium]